MKNRINLTGLILIFIVSGCFKSQDMPYTQEVSTLISVETSSESGKGAKIPNFSWYDADGNEVSFDEFSKDKVVLVSYWATWCFACKMTLPELREVHKIFEDQGVVMLGIVTLETTPEAYRMDYVSRFIREWNLDYAMVLDTDENIMWDAFGITEKGVPTTVIIDRDGRVASAISGSMSVQAFSDEIEKVL